MTKKKPTAAEIIKAEASSLAGEFARWEHIRTHGCNDPLWPDGCNMNLVRNHIIYSKRKLEELCEGKELPEVYYTPTPEKVDDDYMAIDGEFYECRMKNIARLHTNITTKTPAELERQQELF